jgi:uncharacterized protein involved in exopolysaccharide biosynthesis
MNDSPGEGAEGIRFLRFIYRKRKPVLYCFLGALLVTGIVTARLPKRYSSSAIIFPAYNNNLESVIDNPVFGNDVEADRVLQLLESDEVRDSVVEKFHLEKYYGIDKSAPDWNDRLRQKFIHDVNFERTQYMSIIIKAETQEPELSAGIAEYIIHLVDEVRSRIFKKNELTAFQQVEKEYTAKKQKVDSLKSKIASLRGNSNSDLVALINMQGNVQNIAGDLKKGISTELERSLNQYIFEQSSLNEVTLRYEKAKSHYESPITQVYVVDHAKVSYKKVAPSFLINLALAGFCSLVFSISFLLVYEKFSLISSPD